MDIHTLLQRICYLTRCKKTIAIKLIKEKAQFAYPNGACGHLVQNFTIFTTTLTKFHEGNRLGELIGYDQGVYMKISPSFLSYSGSGSSSTAMVLLFSLGCY